MRLIFNLNPPLDFEKSIRAAAFSSVLGVIHAGAYRRLIRDDVTQGLALVEYASVGDAAAPVIEARVLATHGELAEDRLAAHIAHIVNAEADRSAFYAYARNHPALWGTVDALYGLHSFRYENLYDALVCTVIEQQISLKSAQLAEQWLMRWGNQSLTYNGVTYYALPSIQQMAHATLEDLTPLKITFIRMRVLIALAQAGINGDIDFEALRAFTPDALYPRLMGLKGVGHWTAAWAMIRTLGHYVYISSADVALRSAVNHYFYGQQGRAEKSVTDETFAAFGEHGGAAAYHVIMRWAFERY